MRWATFECTMKKVEPQWPSTMPTSSASSRNSASLDRTAAHAGNTLAAELLFAVGMPVAMPPRTDPDVLHSGIRLPPRVCDGKALVRPGMEDMGHRQPCVGNLHHPLPVHPVFLDPSAQRLSPSFSHPWAPHDRQSSPSSPTSATSLAREWKHACASAAGPPGSGDGAESAPAVTGRR